MAPQTKNSMPFTFRGIRIIRMIATFALFFFSSVISFKYSPSAPSNRRFTTNSLLSSSTTMVPFQSTSNDNSDMKHLVLIGGGHAHVQVIKALNARSRPKDLKVTVIDMQKSASYSGMVPGCIAGIYTREQTLLHLEPLTKWSGIDFVEGCVTDIDLESKQIHVKNSKETIQFDAISLDIGSASRGLLDTKGAIEHTIPTRPISELVKCLEKETENLAKRHKDEPSPTKVLVVGGGAAGIELSMSIAGRWKEFSPEITLIHSGTELLPDETKENKQALINIMSNRLGIQIHHNCVVDSVEKDCVTLNDGQKISFTHCIWATGAESHSEITKNLKQRGLAISERGWIKVNSHLQSISHPFIFAAGDCNTVVDGEEKSPPKAGVYAVRSGPILIENLTNYIYGSCLTKYEPQNDFLKLLVCGDGTALGFRFGVPLYGKWVMELKDHIDLKFMNLFSDLPKLTEGQSAGYDTSQYDFSLDRRPPIQPHEAAALLMRTDDDVGFMEAWDVLKDMAEDEAYRDSVLEYIVDLRRVLI